LAQANFAQSAYKQYVIFSVGGVVSNACNDGKAPHQEQQQFFRRVMAAALAPPSLLQGTSPRARALVCRHEKCGSKRTTVAGQQGCAGWGREICQTQRRGWCSSTLSIGTGAEHFCFEPKGIVVHTQPSCSLHRDCLQRSGQVCFEPSGIVVHTQPASSLHKDCLHRCPAGRGSFGDVL